jgi:WD40 repeat protein
MVYLMSTTEETCAACGEPLLAEGHCPRCLFKTTFLGAEPPLEEDEAHWTNIAGYEVYEEIGRGGMGVVYRARHQTLGRQVALKFLLRSQLAEERERERFLREARAAARLRHPGIVEIFEVGESEGIPWYSMNYLPRRGLDLLAPDRLPATREAAACVREVARAVEHAHRHGVLHRDLKPSNILLDENGAPHIADFGLARIRPEGPGERDPDLTRSGQMLGTPGYAAPEQALRGECDERTDVYGLGALLYHLLTGRPPFQGPTLESVLVQLRDADPLPPRRLSPAVPRDLETVCLRCLQKAPVARYASATAVAEELERFLEGRPITARPIGWGELAWRWVRRYPLVAGLCAVILLLVAALVLGTLNFTRQKARLEHRSALILEARGLRQLRDAGSRTRALALLEEAWRVAPGAEIRNEYIAALALREIAPGRPEPGTLPPAPETSGNGLVTAAPRGDAIHLEDSAHAREWQLPLTNARDALVALDERGERLAVVLRGEKRVRVLSSRNGRALATLEHPMGVRSLDWRGELLATGCENRFIYVWDEAGALKHRLSGHEGDEVLVAFRPGGQELASVANDPLLRLWHAGRGEELVSLESKGVRRRGLRWSPDGRRLILAHADGTAWSHDLPGPDCVELLAPPQEEPHAENLGTVVVSPDGSLAAVADETLLRVWDFQQGRLALAVPKAPSQWLSARFSPDGRSLWLCGWSYPLREWRLERNPLGNAVLEPGARTFQGFGNLLRGQSADGGQLVLSNNELGQFLVLELASGRLLRVDQPGTLAVAIDPQGRWLATGGGNQPGLRVWSLPGGQLLHTLAEDQQVYAACASPDGARLILRTSQAGAVYRTRDWTHDRALSPDTPLRAMTYSPDGRYLATLGHDNILLLNPRDFTEAARLTPPPAAGWLGEASLAFSPDARYLLLHTAMGTTLRWNLAQTWRELRRLE